ncbi:uncharacterized protein LOC143278180 [Babylonia areolata]|uniref:uncharacterized protein LOC143278180 n=1 Tax=Babylonia areolata TaxID=304850 RepID=UPI003FD466CA
MLMMKTTTVLFAVSLWTLMLALSAAQSGQYQPASSSLQPLQTDRNGQQVRNDASVASAAGRSDTGSAANSPKDGGDLPDLFQTFDKYLLQSLEDTYYRLRCGVV